MHILKQRKWTTAELKQAGFRPYERKKTVVLARELRPEEAPKKIKTQWDTLVAHAGYMICYDATDGRARRRLDDYPHWPVEPHIFVKTYRKWNPADSWTPNAAERHLIQQGCKPYFKHVGVWAMKLTKPLWIQSPESVEPTRVPAGGWVTIGIAGEPTSMTDKEFRHRYQPAVRAAPRRA